MLQTSDGVPKRNFTIKKLFADFVTVSEALNELKHNRKADIQPSMFSCRKVSPYGRRYNRKLVDINGNTYIQF
ncbi:hypothetical protein HDE_04047 [Halotydeus destructor]|nr:hypothetical protein HDE_04047 [Halotydeus destructor]